LLGVEVGLGRAGAFAFGANADAVFVDEVSAEVGGEGYEVEGCASEGASAGSYGTNAND
jgi:hypothetical protein